MRRVGPALQPRSRLSTARAQAPERHYTCPIHVTLQVPDEAEAPRRAEPAGRSGHAVSLAIKDERHVLAVAEQMLARHIPGLA